MTSLQRRLAKVLVVVGIAVVASGCLPAPLVQIETLAGTGTAGYSGDGGPATEAQFNGLGWVALDAAGNVYLSDSQNSRIRRIDTSGIVSTFAGGNGRGFAGDGGPASAASITSPGAMGFDAAGNLYFVDYNNLRIRRVDTDGIITTVAGTGTPGPSGDGGPATSAELYYASSMAVAADGTLYVADPFNDVVRRIGPDGIIDRFAGTGTSGFAGDGGPAAEARLNGPSGLAVDDDGTLYIADEFNYRVRRVDPSGTITTVAGNGTTGFAGDGGAATDAFIRPSTLALDRSGNLIIGQGAYHVVRIVSLEHNVIGRLAGTANSFGFSGDGGHPASSQLYFPSGIAVDAAGDLIIADSGNHRVRIIRTGGSIGGTVRIGSGPAEGVTVRLYRADDRTTPVATTTSGATGSYGFHVPTGEYVVEFVGDDGHVGEWWSDADDADAADALTVGRGDQERADVQLAAS